jgi:hypothetical protein
MRLPTALLVPRLIGSAQTPPASHYPLRLADARAMYLERPAFALYADGYDTTLYDADTKISVLAKELGYLTVN